MTRPAAYLPTLAAGWSHRQLATAATQCQRVERSSNGSLSVIGFDGVLRDDAAIASHVAGGSGGIETWYDQIGSRSLRQTTDSRQPSAASGGAAEVAEFDRPASSHVIDTGGVVLGERSGWTLAATVMLSGAVGGLQTIYGEWRIGSSRTVLLYASPTRVQLAIRNTADSAEYVPIFLTTLDATYHSIVVRYDGSGPSLVCWIDGAAVALSSATGTLNATMGNPNGQATIGAGTSAAFNVFDGGVYEVLVSTGLWDADDVAAYHNGLRVDDPSLGLTRIGSDGDLLGSHLLGSDLVLGGVL